jgi:hypothetical protein
MRSNVLVLLAVALVMNSSRALAREEGAATPPAWQNPDIGLTVDAVVDAHDADSSWKMSGLTLRGAEMIVSGNVDPYAFLLGNILISEGGAELHEVFGTFHALPLNLGLKAGLMLANFGHWNRFHVHAMPFTSEPRIYREYGGGMLALKGLELSWLLPLSHYVELTFSAYDRITGHSHDTDPSSVAAVSSVKSLDEIAAELGATRHGSHWHGANGEILYEADLYALAAAADSDAPVLNSGLRDPRGFAYGGRLATSFEFGPDFSLDMGGSAIYQDAYRISQRIAGAAYFKFLYGADAVLFWHPLSANKYRNLQLGAELLRSSEQNERMSGGTLYEDTFDNGGVFGWVAYQHSSRWHYGCFAERFTANIFDGRYKTRTGMYTTCAITHYQYLRLEFSRYDYPGMLEGVNRIQLQYDATIGYHTHGRQR